VWEICIGNVQRTYLRIYLPVSCRLYNDSLHAFFSRFQILGAIEYSLFFYALLAEGEPWRSGKAVVLWSWGHGFKSWKQPLTEMQENAVYIRPKVLGPFPRSCTRGSYVHRIALYPLLLASLPTSGIWYIDVTSLVSCFVLISQKSFSSLSIHLQYFITDGLLWFSFNYF
jgi:hypothetical protein